MNLQTLLRERRGVLLAAGAGVAVLLLLAAGRLDGPSERSRIPTALVQRGPVRITVTETGELRATHQATISAPNDKTLVWLAPEGARVAKDDPLVRFESRKYEISTEAAQSTVAVAAAGLRRAESDLAGQRAAEKKARLDYESLPELAEKGFITTNELEAARLAYEEVRAETRSFVAQREAAEANVERAQNALKEQQRKLNQGVVVAPRDGVVVYAVHGDVTSPRKVAVGMLPFEGQELMYLPDPASMTAETEISEYDLAKIRVGSHTELRLEAYPQTAFAGRVTRIASLARQKISRATGKPMGLKVFDVSVEVLDRDERLRPGLTTRVEILVNEHPDALYVPVAGVFVDELDRLVAYLRNGGAWQARPLELGGSTDRVAIVASGLEEGDEIALVRPSPGA
jgi:RND family efflux transporter MFP subunit